MLSEISQEQKDKISLRFLEEYEMLKFCFTDIKAAYKAEKVTEEGLRLIEVIKDLTNSKEELSKKVTNFLSEDGLKAITELKSLLEKEGKHYRL